MSDTFWTMTDFDGCGYVNNCKGDTILKTVDLDTANQIAYDLNTNPLVVRTFKAEERSIIKKIVTKKGI